LPSSSGVTAEIFGLIRRNLFFCSPGEVTRVPDWSASPGRSGLFVLGPLLQHASSGYDARIDVWSRDLNELGISTKQPFTYKDACVFHGPHTGYDPEAAQAAKESVKAFFKSVLKLQ
jgi:hypothetical protein